MPSPGPPESWLLIGSHQTSAAEAPNMAGMANPVHRPWGGPHAMYYVLLPICKQTPHANGDPHMHFFSDQSLYAGDPKGSSYANVCIWWSGDPNPHMQTKTVWIRLVTGLSPYAYGDHMRIPVCIRQSKSPYYATKHHMHMVSDWIIPMCIQWSCYGDPRMHTAIPIVCIRHGDGDTFDFCKVFNTIPT